MPQLSDWLKITDNEYNMASHKCLSTMLLNLSWPQLDLAGKTFIIFLILIYPTWLTTRLFNVLAILIHIHAHFSCFPVSVLLSWCPFKHRNFQIHWLFLLASYVFTLSMVMNGITLPVCLVLPTMLFMTCHSFLVFLLYSMYFVL